jgi:hypothetical protein
MWFKNWLHVPRPSVSHIWDTHIQIRWFDHQELRLPCAKLTGWKNRFHYKLVIFTVVYVGDTRRQLIGHEETKNRHLIFQCIAVQPVQMCMSHAITHKLVGVFKVCIQCCSTILEMIGWNDQYFWDGQIIVFVFGNMCPSIVYTIVDLPILRASPWAQD